MSIDQSTPRDIGKFSPTGRSMVVKVAPDPHQGKIVLGKYRLTSRIAKGGMGAIYLSRDTSSGAQFAVKILRNELVLEPKIRKRFLNESQAAMRIKHPEVAETYDVGELSSGEIFIIMEFVDGPTLRRLLRKGALSQSKMVSIGISVCRGLLAAHQSGVVHRDLKPENIIIPRNLENEIAAKIVDFGVARIIDAPRITTTQHVMGTPQYISPEQAMGGPVDKQADIYSLGVVFYEMLTGGLPFYDDDAQSLLLKHIKNLPKGIKEMCPALEIDRDLEEMVMGCLEKDPLMRPDGVVSVLNVLTSI